MACLRRCRTRSRCSTSKSWTCASSAASARRKTRSVYTPEGVLVVSVAQEGLIRRIEA